jgi:hypothetical protein
MIGTLCRAGIAHSSRRDDMGIGLGGSLKFRGLDLIFQPTHLRRMKVCRDEGTRATLEGSLRVRECESLNNNTSIEFSAAEGGISALLIGQRIRRRDIA